MPDVDDVLTYAHTPLSDAQIRERSLSEDEITPDAQDV